jgi:ATP-binding protein involved in chromosome partitioning
MFKRTNVKILGIIENMTSFTSDDGVEHFIFGKDGGKNIASKFNLELLGQISINKDIGNSCETGMPYMESIKEKSDYKVFLEITKKIEELLI